MLLGVGTGACRGEEGNCSSMPPPRRAGAAREGGRSCWVLSKDWFVSRLARVEVRPREVGVKGTPPSPLSPLWPISDPPCGCGVLPPAADPAARVSSRTW